MCNLRLTRSPGPQRAMLAEFVFPAARPQTSPGGASPNEIPDHEELELDDKAKHTVSVRFVSWNRTDLTLHSFAKSAVVGKATRADPLQREENIVRTRRSTSGGCQHVHMILSEAIVDFREAGEEKPDIFRRCFSLTGSPMFVKDTITAQFQQLEPRISTRERTRFRGTNCGQVACHYLLRAIDFVGVIS